MIDIAKRDGILSAPAILEEKAVRGMSRTADVVIIGGGIQGASIAYHLTQRGHTNVVILEKETLASGCSGDCSVTTVSAGP